MTLTVDVRAISQDVLLGEDGVVTQNFVLLTLPNGGVVKAAIDAPAAEALIDAMVRGGDSPRLVQQERAYAPPPAPRPESPEPRWEAPPSADFQEGLMPDGSKGLVFGGAPSPPPPAAPKRKPSVTKDAYGYPVVRSAEPTADVGEIVAGVGTPGADEDGVGSI